MNLPLQQRSAEIKIPSSQDIWRYKEEGLIDFSLYQEIAQASLLDLAGDQKTAKRLYRRALKKAEKKEAFQLVSFFADKLGYYALKEGNKVRYTAYRQQKIHYDHLQDQYGKAFDLHREVQFLINADYTPIIAERQHIESVLKRIKALFGQTNIIKIHHLYSKVASQYCLAVGDYKYLTTVALATNRMLSLTATPNDRAYFCQHSFYLQTTACLYQRQVEKGLSLCKKYMKTYRSRQENHFALMHNYFLLAMYGKNYLLARTVSDKVAHQKAFIYTSAPLKERWWLCNAYLALYTKTSLRAREVQQQASVASIKDEQTYQVHLLIVTSLLFLKEQNWEKATFYINKLVKYAHRKLKEVYHQRTKHFITILDTLIKADFNYEQAAQSSQESIKQLKTVPMQILQEIVPYDHLVEKVFEWYEKICRYSEED
ncbi:MAG: hypothetical protein ACFB0B_07830 [Thermonemataceae bacterium]